MGGKPSKADKDKLEGLDIFEKRNQINLLFNLNNGCKTEITQDKVKSVWLKYLSQGLLTSLTDVIFKNGKLYILYDDFVKFYWRSCEDTSEKEAEVIIELSKSYGNGCDKYECLSFTVLEFLKSYFKICALETDSSYNQWMKFGCPNNDGSTLTTYLMESLSEQEIDLDSVDSWITKNGLFRIISHHVYKTIFNTISLEQKKRLIPNLIHKPRYSSILTPSELIFLQWNLGQKTTHKWRLLFCIDTDGQSWSTFLKSITAQGPTVIVIHDTNGFVFGAFASQSWNTNPKFYGDEDSFLFTLAPKMNTFETSGYNKNYQYINSGQSTLPNGLGMGGVHNYWGLFLKTDFGKGLVSESCTTFKHYKKLAPDKEFNVDKLQVWGVGAPDPTPEELGERTTSILDKDPAAAAILELAGRPLHSTEIRKIKSEDE